MSYKLFELINQYVKIYICYIVNQKYTIRCIENNIQV